MIGPEGCETVFLCGIENKHATGASVNVAASS